MKILITGAGGFLGRRAAAYFRALGWQVIAPARTELDITDAAEVRRRMLQYKPQAVLHCAAVSDTGACRSDPQGTALINVQGAENVAFACRMLGIKAVLCSSDQVYAGSILPAPHREDELLMPSHAYAQQKLQAERLWLGHCPDGVCLRLSWMYDAVPQPAEHGSFMTMLLAALRDESLPLCLPVHDRRGITDVNAVINALPKALALEGGVYNFGAPGGEDTFHTLQKVFGALGLADALARLRPDEQAFAAAPRDIRMDCTRAAAAGIVFEDTQQGLCRVLRAVL